MDENINPNLAYKKMYAPNIMNQYQADHLKKDNSLNYALKQPQDSISNLHDHQR